MVEVLLIMTSLFGPSLVCVGVITPLSERLKSTFFEKIFLLLLRQALLMLLDSNITFKNSVDFMLLCTQCVASQGPVALL